MLRYEIKNLTPPEAILRSMQAQITAEREKRALIATSEGERQQEINIADGEKQAAVLRVRRREAGGDQQGAGRGDRDPRHRRGHRRGVRAVAEAIGDKGGLDAANLKVAQQYVEAFANLAKSSNTLILPVERGRRGGHGRHRDDGARPHPPGASGCQGIVGQGGRA